MSVAEHRSFAAAASHLGLNQVTVAKMVSSAEDAIGYPLFFRRRSGAVPTPRGEILLESGRAVASAVRQFEERMAGLRAFEGVVTVGAPEGILSYTLIPFLLGGDGQQPLDRARIRHILPALGFTIALDEADVCLWATSEGMVPPLTGAVRVRRVGSMHFRPFANMARLKRGDLVVRRFDDLKVVPLFRMPAYRYLGSLGPWNGLCEEHKERVDECKNTREMHNRLLGGGGVGLFPDYSGFYERESVPLDMLCPRLAVSLWLAARDDVLRQPEVRRVYDTLGDLFLASPWFRDRASVANRYHA